MRIISGKNKGRKIVTPANLPIRPTTELGKESLFNILNHYFYFNRISVLDLFAGTGNITYEFASRGAVQVVTVEQHHACVAFIKKIISELHYDNVQVIPTDVFQFLSKCQTQFDIIFADPPYTMENIETIPTLVFEKELLKPDGWLIIEHSKEHDFSSLPQFYQHRKYGKLNFSFLVNFTSNNEE